MKPSHLLIITLAALTLTACGTSQLVPAPTEPTDKGSVQSPTAKESDNILDLGMEKSLTELNKVE